MGKSISAKIVKMQPIGLVKYDAMLHAIEVAVSVDEVKELRDKARAVEIYMKQAQNFEAERELARIRLRADVRLGELLIAMQESGERRGKTDGKSKVSNDPTPKLTTLGITRDQSSRWQKMASVPKPEREAYLKSSEIPTEAGLLALADNAKAKPRMTADQEMARWLWCELSDMHRRLEAADPSKIARAAADYMANDYKKLIPTVVRVLREIKESL